MKKLIALLLAVVMVMGLAACGSKTTTETKAPTEAKVDTPATEAKTDAPAAAGSVYYLNFKPEFDQALQGLAASYTEKTGVPVKVVTAASGDYSNTLNAQMGKDGAPTVYNIGNMSGLKDWDEYALDLTGTPLAGELTTNDFNLYNEAGELKAMGYCYETFGIIVNTKLLADAGHSLDEIKDFASLKAVADDIHARAAELGFDAFSSAGLDGSSSWRFSGHLANMPLYYEFRDDGVKEQPAEIKGTYLDNFRNIWDLYITDSAADPTTLSAATGDQSEAEFGEGKAVFYQNGTWEYAALTADKSPSTAALTAKRRPACAPAPRTAGQSTARPRKRTSRLLWTSCIGWSPIPTLPLSWSSSWAVFPSRAAPLPPTSSSLTATICWLRATTL